MRVLVTGATGAVGPMVVAALVAAGYGVRALVRTAPPVGLLPDGVELAYGDITAPQTLLPAMTDCTGVIHGAALLHIVNPTPALRSRYEQVNVGGTANVLAAAQAAGVKRLVFLSTIAVYGHGQSHTLTEETPPHPDSLYGATKLAAEGLVLAARCADGQPLGVVLRLAAVYGARVKGNYQRLLDALRRQRFLPIGQGANRRTLIYDRDVAAAALLALQHSKAAGRIYNVTDGSVHTLAEVVDAICQALGQRSPRLYVPIPPVRLAIGLLEDGLALVGHPAPVGRATLAKYLEEMLVDGRRLQQELGFAPRYSLVNGWQEIINTHG